MLLCVASSPSVEHVCAFNVAVCKPIEKPTTTETSRGSYEKRYRFEYPGEEVCDVCGVRYASQAEDNPDWHERASHLNGKMHHGWLQIRKKLQELKEKERAWEREDYQEKQGREKDKKEREKNGKAKKRGRTSSSERGRTKTKAKRSRSRRRRPCSGSESVSKAKRKSRRSRDRGKPTRRNRSRSS